MLGSRPALLLLAGLLGLGTLVEGQVPRRVQTQPLVRPTTLGADNSELVASLPPGFLDEIVWNFTDRTVGLTFASDGRLFFWEKIGRIWYWEDGQPTPGLFLDITEEVADWSAHGMLGFALDPDFYTNGHVYLLYVVDYHHLTKFGTPEYDPLTTITGVDTIGRVARYTANAGDGFRSVDLGTRLVLLGEDIDNGFPICASTHGVGSLVFGTDGTLLVSCGDGADPAGESSGTCLSDGIITAKEDVGRFRSQLVDSLSGKVLRLDPATGDGLPSNPFYDVGAPRSARSRVWALGLRQPFRFTVRPGSGSARPADGDPGTLTIGDVGKSDWEEVDVARTGGQNFGWPLYEGLDPQPLYFGDLTPNQDASNPLYQQFIRGMGTCNQEFFDFQDLLVQDTQNAPFWANPCDPVQSVVTSVPLFMHTRPALTWTHAGGAVVPVFDVFGEADTALVGDPGSPVTGPQFAGNASIGGAWYTGTAFPLQYQGAYFMGDYGLSWINTCTFDGNDELQSVSVFGDPAGRVVAMAMHPVDESLYYIDYTDIGVGQLHRVSYVVGNIPPTAAVASTLNYGPGPLTVEFDAGASFDPEGEDLQFEWDFGDGTPPSRVERPKHVYPTEDITATGTFIGAVFEQTPPGSQGVSNLDPEVMRDGDYPPVNTGEVNRQFDTFHSDKSGIDWIGYEFPAERELTGVLFQEGTFVGPTGGWWLTLEVQVRQGGSWETVLEVETDPQYPGLGLPYFEMFEFRFPATTGDAVRLYGLPGGSLQFVTIGELRVLAEPAVPVTQPTNYDVTVTVTDSIGATDDTSTFVSLNNTPPVVSITLPIDLGTYSTTAPDLIDMRAAVSDAEHTLGELTCGWQVLLHHDNHTHPGIIDSNCITTALLDIDGCPDVHFQEVRLTMTDPLGLATTTSHYLIPDADLNHNGVCDPLDLAAGTSKDANANTIPDEAEVDCNNDGVPDIHQIFFGYLPDMNGNGVPDGCEEYFPVMDGQRGGGTVPGPGGFPPGQPPGPGPLPGVK